MKALSVRAPWWWFILHAGKRVENRDWEERGGNANAARQIARTGETILLQSSAWWSLREFCDLFDAGKSMASDEHWAHVRSMPRPLTPQMFKDGGGKIVGRLRLADVVRNGHDATGWAVPGDIGLILADVEAIDKPVPFKGNLGFFEVPEGLLSGATWTKAATEVQRDR